MKKLILKFLRPYVLQIIAESNASKKWTSTMTSTDTEDDKPPRTGGGAIRNAISSILCLWRR